LAKSADRLMNDRYPDMQVERRTEA
jgi:hypothetical protein